VLYRLDEGLDVVVSAGSPAEDAVLVVREVGLQVLIVVEVAIGVLSVQHAEIQLQNSLHVAVLVEQDAGFWHLHFPAGDNISNIVSFSEGFILLLGQTPPAWFPPLAIAIAHDV
jgi:hypothetical protein